MKTASTKPSLASYRKACRPTGVGLSHYVLVVNRPTDTEKTEAGNR